jgi:hypothetical protein
MSDRVTHDIVVVGARCAGRIFALLGFNVDSGIVDGDAWKVAGVRARSA